MSEIRSTGVAARIKRAAVASGLALATVSWLGVSAMPASAFDTECTVNGSGTEVTFTPDDTDYNAHLYVDHTDGRLYVTLDGWGTWACTNNFTQTKKVESIALGSDENYLASVYIDTYFLSENASVDITSYSYDSSADFALYTTSDDTQPGVSIDLSGSIYNIVADWGNIHVDAYNEDYFDDVAVAGSGGSDTITSDIDMDGETLYVNGDQYDYWDESTWGTDCEGGPDRGAGDDTIDLSAVSGVTSYAYIGGDGGDDTIFGTMFEEDIYGCGGFDYVKDNAGDDVVYAEYFDAGATRQGEDDYTGEYNGEVCDAYCATYDYSARTKDLYLIANDECTAGEVGEFDCLDYAWDSNLVWLMAGSGNDVLVAEDGDVTWLSPGAGTNRLDCAWDTDDEDVCYADYSSSPNAVNVDLAAGTGSGWGTDRYIGVDDVYGSLQGDTINGNDNYNEIYGQDGDDVINGAGSGDDLYGDAGSDTIHGDSGGDDIEGGAGTDSLFGDSGYDDIYGDAGNDSINGGTEDDDMYGGTGEDRVHLSAGDDYFDGEEGRNIVDASGLESKVRIDLQFGEAAWDGWFTEIDNVVDAVGSPFADRIVAWPFGTGDEYIGSKISGGAGNDDLIGLNGPDQLRGNAGDDVIRAGAGSDNLRGGAGDDELWGGAGVDSGNGGAGSDVCKSVERAKNCSATGMAKVLLNSRI